MHILVGPIRKIAFVTAAAGLVGLFLAGPAAAQTDPVTPPQQQPAAETPAPQPPPTPSSTSTSDARLDPLQPDFVLAALPVTLRMPAHKLAFRVTHRFTRNLGRGDLSDLLQDFFGFDSG